MARGSNNDLSKYTQVFDKKKGKEEEQEAEGSKEIPPEEAVKTLKDEVSKRESLEAELAAKDEQIHELHDRISNMENLDLEEELRQKVEELNQIKNAYQKKMKNTIALQRIKYEKEIDKIRKDMKKIALTKGGFDEDLRRREQEIETREEKIHDRERELNAIKEELEEMKARIKEGGDAGTGTGASTEELAAQSEMVDKLQEKISNREIEIQNLKDALEDEKKKKEGAQAELVNVKKGSVAMMKYITTLQNKKQEEELSQMRESLETEINKRMEMEERLQAREAELATRETELARKIQELSAGKQVDLQTVKSLETELEKKGLEIKKKEELLKNREKEIIAKFKSLEEEIKKKIKDGKIIQDIKREFAAKEEDLRHVKEILKEKEAELKRRETELEHRIQEMGADQALEKEIERLQGVLAKKDSEIEKLKTGGENMVDSEEVAALQGLVLEREEDLKQKEKTIEALQTKISEMATSGGDVDAGVVQKALAEKESEIDLLKKVIEDKDRMITKATSAKASGGSGMKELFEEVKDLRAQLDMKHIELEKLKSTVAYKDEEISRREIEIQHKEEVIKKEFAKIEEAKKLGASVEESQLKKRLEALEMQITQKEEELQRREKYISMKMEDLKKREGQLVEEDLAARSSERELEFKEEKIKIGNPRLDDLLYGGIPLGKQILIMGPPFIGKETLVNNFLLEGVKKGMPALVLVTDCSPDDIREELKYILPDIEQYEEKGLMKYIDAYSKAMGMEGEDPHTIFVEHPTDYKGINKAIETITKEFKKISKYWRMAVRSISTLVTYSDPTTTYRFLQGMTGRAKRGRIVAMYVLDKGMHNEQEIQTLGHLMDGAFEFKTDGVKTFLLVQGVCDVQSRQWIQYQYSKRALNVGSFSLDKIK